MSTLFSHVSHLMKANVCNAIIDEVDFYSLSLCSKGTILRLIRRENSPMS